MAKNPGLVRIREQLAGLVRAPYRFPVTLACAAGWAGITILREHFGGEFQWDEVERIQVYMLLGLFASLTATLFAEARDWPVWRRYLLSAAATGIVILIAWLGSTGNDAYQSPAFLFMGPGLVLLMIVAPYLRRGAENYLVWDFNFCSWVSAAFGFLVAFVIAMGGIGALGALEVLFGLNISGDYYGDVWIIAMSVIWPWQTLAGVPGAFKDAKKDYAPRWAEYLISWLLMPLALLYLALLYAFAVKITAQWSLPQGQVGWLVGGFAGFGLAVWHAAHPLRETGNRLVRGYFKYFHAALAVPVVLLAVGTGARVAEYGITEKRYGLIVLTCWLAGITAHGLWRRAPRLNVAPVSFAVLLILASFGPWGASSVSIRSQLGQLESLLADAGILIDGKIEPEEGLADPGEVKRISSIVSYMRSSGKQEPLYDWLADAGVASAKEPDNKNILTSLGLEYVTEWENVDAFSFWLGEPEVMEVTGFDFATRFSWYGIGEDDFDRQKVVKQYVTAIEGGILVIARTGRPDAKVTFDLAALAERLDAEFEDADAETKQLLMTLDAAGGGLRARLYVESIGGLQTGDAFELNNLSATLLVGRVD